MLDIAFGIAVCGLILAVFIGAQVGLRWLDENRPMAYKWTVLGSSAAIFGGVVIDAFFVPFSSLGVAVLLVLSVPWIYHSFALRNRERFEHPEQENG